MLKKFIRFFPTISSFILVGLIIASLLVLQKPLPSLEALESLPPLEVHPLPFSLQQWQDQQNQGDYFANLESSPVGALLWSEFPVKVYFEQSFNPKDISASNQRSQQWLKIIKQAIQEWCIYLPLIEVQQRDSADILIERSFPPMGTTFNPDTRKLEIPRARTAQTRYDFYLKDSILSHRMTIQISPSLSESSILSATRHELGHALGIWGHSTVESDALYFSQVRQSPSISARDINTLKKVYQQPTRLGWAISNSKSEQKVNKN